MARAAVAVGVLALVVMAGCMTAQPASPEPVEDPSVDLPYDDRDAGDPPYDAYDNPWRTDEIIVVVEDRAGMERNIAPDVMSTLHYWEEEAESKPAYDPEYRLVDQHPNPDIRVEVVRTVKRCGVHEDAVALGCAPVLREDDEVEGTTTVQVRAGHSSETMRAILKHEFGHTLGYRHGDDPGNVMAGNLSARAPADIVNASDRRYPWASETLEVAVRSPNGTTDAQLERVRRALDYYENGADGTVPNPPSLELVAGARDADVVVSLRESVGECGVVGPESSCVAWNGPDIDEDPKPEYYTRAHIVVGADGHDRAGWHVGYWLGQSLWTDGVPMPFYGSNQQPAGTW